MKLVENFKCGSCGYAASLPEVLAPPVDNKPAQELPCPKCNQINWQVVKK